jgi:hypothetical protein
VLCPSDAVIIIAYGPKSVIIGGAKLNYGTIFEPRIINDGSARILPGTYIPPL